jgi:hypothetical protein
MRVAPLSSLVLLLACGGAAQKPADSPPEEKSSPESTSSSSADLPGGAAASTASDSPSHAAAAPASSASVPAESSPTPAAVHPVPAVTGSIDGKPFTPKLARVAGPMQKDGRILLALGEGTDCTTSNGPTLTLMVPWQDGYKADLGSLKRSSKKGPGEITFSRSKKDVSTTFKPSGTVTIVSAPMTQNATGKMKIDLQSGDYMLAGDLDIQVCVSPAK